LGLELVLSLNAHVGLLVWVASVEDGLANGFELGLVLIQLFGSIIGGTSTSNSDKGLSLVLLLATLRVRCKGDLKYILGGVLFSFPDLLHLSLLGLGLGDWRDDFFLSYQCNDNSLFLIVLPNGGSNV